MKQFLLNFSDFERIKLTILLSLDSEEHLQGTFVYIDSECTFIICLGKVVVEASLDKEVFYHGEDIPLHISINNQSKKQAKSIMVSLKSSIYIIFS